jgi:uncharacterized protein YcgL (UPF0745 family)
VLYAPSARWKPRCCRSRIFVTEPESHPTMRAYVYKSLEKADTYVYLAERDAFVRLPDGLRHQLGALQFVLDVDLVPERTLARADPTAVRDSLRTRGFHVQLPANVGDPMSDDWGTDA